MPRHLQGHGDDGWLCSKAQGRTGEGHQGPRTPYGCGEEVGGFLGRPVELDWMARQGRADLAYGISRVQQMAGARDPDTIKTLNQLVKKAREPYELIYQHLPGTIEDLVFLAVSDASEHAEGPVSRGMMILVANKEILEGESQVNCLLYHSAVLNAWSAHLAAEISQAAETLDQCEYVAGNDGRDMGPSVYAAAVAMVGSSLA